MDSKGNTSEDKWENKYLSSQTNGTKNGIGEGVIK